MDFAGADSAAEAAARWEGTAASRYTSGAAWGFVDSRDGGAVAGVAEEIPAVSDLPSAISAMGWLRGTGEGAAETGQAVADRRPTPSGGSLHRRDVRSREKRGLGVGPTKRGKGTKITAITVGDSIPIAVSVQAASPHESQLVEEDREDRHFCLPQGKGSCMASEKLCAWG